MELNIVSIMYLFFRLAPFVIVSYFAISSIFNKDLKGIIYMAGLLIACFVTYIFGAAFSTSIDSIVNANGDSVEKSPVCNLLTLKSGGSFSEIPLGISILTYTFFYFLYVIIKYELIFSNIPILVVLPSLIIGDYMWNNQNNCYNWFKILVSILIGGFIGYMWAYIVDSFGRPNLQFFNVLSNQVVCERPSRQLFKCTFQ